MNSNIINNNDPNYNSPIKRSSLNDLPPASNEKLLNNNNERFARRTRAERERDLQEKEREKEEQLKKEKQNEKETESEYREFMKPNGSFVYQTLIEFHRVYSIFYFIVEELLFIYKKQYFHFPQSSFGMEVTSLIFYFFVQLARLHFGTIGNRSETSVFVLFGLIFSVGAVYTYLHFMFCQTYVLKIELITNGIGIVLWVLELVFSLVAFLAIAGQESGM